MESHYLMRSEFPFRRMRKFQNLAAQQCECTQHHRTVHLKMVETVNVILCIFYHIKKKKKKTLRRHGHLGSCASNQPPRGHYAPYV